MTWNCNSRNVLIGCACGALAGIPVATALAIAIFRNGTTQALYIIIGTAAGAATGGIYAGRAEQSRTSTPLQSAAATQPLLQGVDPESRS